MHSQYFSANQEGRMRTFLMAVTFFVTAVCSAVTARADSLTIGHTTFDFDAPSSPLSAGQQAFFKKYKDAVNRHDEAALLALQDGSKKRCTASGEQLILKDLEKTIPDDAKVRFFITAYDFAKEMGLGDLAYLPVAPTAVLGISGRAKTETGVKVFTILRPVRQVGETISLVPYCLTEKGKALFEKQKASQP
jgi:hypothetical protein